jgi:hypothetical protein
MLLWREVELRVRQAWSEAVTEADWKRLRGGVEEGQARQGELCPQIEGHGVAVRWVVNFLEASAFLSGRHASTSGLGCGRMMRWQRRK